MYRLLPLFLVTLSLQSQTPNLDKPPQDVDDALRARITRFYDFHVQRKFRLAEQLIADDAKDDYYELSKPDLLGFRIGNIEYSENFTKAKVTIVGNMKVLLPMIGGKVMDMPFASYWKLIDGTWYWYFNKVAARQTPFGEAKPSTDPNARPASSLPTPINIDIEKLQSAVKIDRTNLDIAGDKPTTAKLVNTLPGNVTLSINCPLRPIADTGLTASFDKKELKSNETAVLTLTADPRTKAGSIPLRISVSPTNQVLDLTVNVSH